MINFLEIMMYLTALSLRQCLTDTGRAYRTKMSHKLGHTTLIHLQSLDQLLLWVMLCLYSFVFMCRLLSA